MHDEISLAQRRGFWVWLLGSGLCAAVVFCLLTGENRDLGLHVLGLVFAGTASTFAILARRAGAGMAVVAVWGLAFGVWFPDCIASLEPITRHWLGELGLNDPHLVRRLPLPVAIATTGTTTGAVMYLMTRSGRVVIQTVLLSLVVAATPMLPVHEEGAVMGGIIAWHVAVYGSLFRWMVDCVREGAGLSCAACGFDLVGLTSPVCPGCGRNLTRRESVAPSRVRVAVSAPKPAGRWY